MFSFWKSKKEGDEGGKSAHLWIILVGAALGICLLLFGGKTSTTEEVEKESTYSPQEDEMVLYQTYLEERVKKLCESVDGIGNVTVIVTLSGGFESVYATELTDAGEEYVIVGSGSSAQPLYLSRNAPKIEGIGVVCHGSASAVAKQELISLLSKGMNVPSNHIYITQ